MFMQADIGFTMTDDKHSPDFIVPNFTSGPRPPNIKANPVHKSLNKRMDNKLV
jgi:hypothetical protein